VKAPNANVRRRAALAVLAVPVTLAGVGMAPRATAAGPPNAAGTARPASAASKIDHPAPRPEPPAKEDEHGRADALAFLGVAIEGGSRSFSYTDRLTPTLRPYDLFVAPLVAIEGEIYPLARTRALVLKDFGITARYAVAFALSSADSSGQSTNASWDAFDIGARERISLGKAVLAGVHGGYGVINYSVGEAPLSNPASEQLPDVGYRFVRGGLDLRVQLGSLSVYAFGSYLSVLSAGAMGTLFPRASVGGIEARVGAAQAVGGGFEVSLDLAYTRFYYSLRPEPGDPYVAGGALDQMARVSLGVGRTF
jgi:hypothetical protein